LILAGISCLVGFAWLALAMNAHWQQVMGTSAPSTQVRIKLRLLGESRPFVVGRAVFYRRPSIHGGIGLDYVLGGSGAVGWYVVELAPTVVADGVAEPLNTFACAQHPD
jgi:hypothetical protein